jgi:membrane protein
VSRLWQILKRSFAEWNGHEAPRLGAALAFYTILSMAPLLIVVVAIAGFVFGKATVQKEILTQITALVGQSGEAAVRAMLTSAHNPAAGVVSSVLGVVVLLFGASGVFTELRSTLNIIFDAKAAESKGGLMGMVRERLFSFGMVLAVGFLLLVSLVISTLLGAFGRYSSGILPLPEAVLQAINFVVSFAVITSIFAVTFRYVPDTRLRWKPLWIGAAFTAFLFTIGKFLIGLYLGKAAVGSAYGAAGSVVVIIVWLYYSAQILFFGAAFTREYAGNQAEAPEPSARGKVSGSGEGKLEKNPNWEPALNQPKSDLQQIFLGLAAVIAFRRWRGKS